MTIGKGLGAHTWEPSELEGVSEQLRVEKQSAPTCVPPGTPSPPSTAPAGSWCDRAPEGYSLKLRDPQGWLRCEALGVLSKARSAPAVTSSRTLCPHASVSPPWSRGALRPAPLTRLVPSLLTYDVLHSFGLTEFSAFHDTASVAVRTRLRMKRVPPRLPAHTAQGSVPGGLGLQPWEGAAVQSSGSFCRSRGAGAPGRPGVAPPRPLGPHVRADTRFVRTGLAREARTSPHRGSRGVRDKGRHAEPGETGCSSEPLRR